MKCFKEAENKQKSGECFWQKFVKQNRCYITVRHRERDVLDCLWNKEKSEAFTLHKSKTQGLMPYLLVTPGKCGLRWYRELVDKKAHITPNCMGTLSPSIMRVDSSVQVTCCSSIESQEKSICTSSWLLPTVSPFTYTYCNGIGIKHFIMWSPHWGNPMYQIRNTVCYTSYTPLSAATHTQLEHFQINTVVIEREQQTNRKYYHANLGSCFTALGRKLQHVKPHFPINSNILQWSGLSTFSPWAPSCVRNSLR